MMWEEDYRAALEQIGFTAGRASPYCVFHKDCSIHLVVRGDDLTAMGLRADPDWYEERLGQSFELKIRGRIGEDTDLKTMRILNRIGTLTGGGLIYESDPRHAKLIARSLILEEGKGVGTPGVKPPDISNEAVKEGLLEPWDDAPCRDSKPEGFHEDGRAERRTINCCRTRKRKRETPSYLQ